jgi:uncharacterized membrane protein
MLIPFPLGLLATAVIFDIIYLVTGNTSFTVASFWNIAVGILGGLVAAVFGLLDWLAIPAGTRARQIGLLHGGGNVVVVVLFALSWWLRSGRPEYVPSAAAVVLSVLAVVLGAVFAAFAAGAAARRMVANA